MALKLYLFLVAQHARNHWHNMTGISNYCMQNNELAEYLNEYDNIIYTFNDPSNDNGALLIEDGEGARPFGKNFIRIHIVDDFALFNSYWHHKLEIRYGIPYSHSGE